MHVADLAGAADGNATLGCCCVWGCSQCRCKGRPRERVVARETPSFPAVIFKEGRSSRIHLDETCTEQATGTDTGHESQPLG